MTPAVGRLRPPAIVLLVILNIAALSYRGRTGCLR